MSKENLNQYPRSNNVKDISKLKKVMLINNSQNNLFVDLDGDEGTTDDVITLGSKRKEIVLLTNKAIELIQKKYRTQISLKIM